MNYKEGDTLNTDERIGSNEAVSLEPNIKIFNTDILENEPNFSFAKFRDESYMKQFKERLAKNLRNDKNLIPNSTINGEGIPLD